MPSATIQVWSGSQAIELQNSTIVRKIDLPPSWNTIRFGMLYGMSSGSSANVANSCIAFGICSGSTNVFGDAVTGNFFGLKLSGSSLTYVSGTTNIARYYTGTTGYMLSRCAGTADLVSADFVGNWFHMVSDDNTGKQRLPVFVEVVKGSPTYSIKAWYAGAINANYGRATPTRFLNDMLVTTPTAEGLALTLTSTYNIAVNETLSGSFDSINVAWNKESTQPSLLIYALAVAVMK